MCRAQGLILINPLWPTRSSYTVCVRKRESEPGHHVLLWVGQCLGIVSMCVCGPAVPWAPLKALSPSWDILLPPSTVTPLTSFQAWMGSGFLLSWHRDGTVSSLKVVGGTPEHHLLQMSCPLDTVSQRYSLLYQQNIIYTLKDKRSVHIRKTSSHLKWVHSSKHKIYSF